MAEGKKKWVGVGGGAVVIEGHLRKKGLLLLLPKIEFFLSHKYFFMGLG